jgi:hypothetical protein
MASTARRRRARIAWVVVVATALAATVFVLNQRHVATPVPLRDAVQNFRATQVEDGTRTSTGEGSPTLLEPSSTTVVSPVRDSAGRPAMRAGAAPGAATPAALEGYTRPAEGVYTYRTTGGESISLAGARHDYPDETYATVRHRAGCEWETELDLLEEHVEKRTACSEPGRLLDVQTVRKITFFGRTETEELHCVPPIVDHETDERPGTPHRGRCHSEDASAEITATFVGRERLVVGGVRVDAVHLTFHAVLSGRAEGTGDEDMWTLPSTGLVLRWVRSTDADADAAFGARIHYRERATLVLESLEPTT